MYNDFKPEKLQEFLPYFIEGIEDILLSWCSREATASLMKKRALSEDEMVNIVGIRILSYTFDIIEQTESLQHCPYAEQLVTFFDDHKIKINELFLIYMDLSAVVREYLFTQIASTQKEMQSILEDFSIIFEYNLSDVLSIYFNLQLQKIEREKENVLKERKLLEDYKKIVDTINGVIITDKDGFITFVNDKFCEYSGYRREALLYRTLQPLRDPDNPTSFYKKMWATLKAKKSFHSIIKNRKKDKTPFYVDSTISPLLDKDGNITHYISLQRDITKEIEQEEQLQKLRAEEENTRLTHIENKKLYEFIHTLPIPTIILNEFNIISHYNDQFLSIFDPFTNSSILEKLTQQKLLLQDILNQESKQRFQIYPAKWPILYESIYDKNPLIIECKNNYNESSYQLKVSSLNKRDAIVCLEHIQR